MDSLMNATDQEPEQIEFDRLNWLTSKEAGKYLRKSANAIRIMIYRGYIRPRKLRNRWYFRKIELDRLLESSPY